MSEVQGKPFLKISGDLCESAPKNLERRGAPQSSSPPVFRLGPHVAKSVKRFLMSRGWKQWHDPKDSAIASESPPGGSSSQDDDSDALSRNRPTSKWNLFWKDSPFSKELHQSMDGLQRVNHFRNTSTITRKDRLSRNLEQLSQLQCQLSVLV